MKAETGIREIDHGKYDFRTKESLAVKLDEGLSEKTVREISALKKEPAWMLELRLKSFQEFLKKPVPAWGAGLDGINFDEIDYYARQDAPKARNWEDVPKEIKDTFEKLGVPEAERKYLAGSIAQFKSEAIYHNLKKDWEDKGVIFTDMDTALQKYPDFVRKHFMRAVPFNDNKFAALHGAVWSGGTFLYVPKNVKVDLPLQNYFRMNSGREGMFEHTMIILEEGAKASYVEGCTAPRYEEASVHSAIIEVFVGENAQASYTSVQNWSNNIYNCLSGDTRVYTTNRGLVELKDIQVGDSVFAFDQADRKLKEKRVVNRWNKGLRKIFRVRFSNGSEIKATAEHPILSFNKEKKRLEWKKVSEITVGDIAWMSKEIPAYKPVKFIFEVGKPRTGKYKHVKYPERASLGLMWLLGLYVGDGSRQYSKPLHKYTAVVYSVPTSESIHGTLVKTAFNEFDVSPTIRLDGIATTFSSVVFARFLQEFGFSGDAHGKRIPSWVYAANRENRLSFLAGIIDSDGHVTKDGYCAQIIGCNRMLLEDVRYLALSSGLGASTIIKRDYPSVHKKIIINKNEAHAGDSYILKLSNIQNLKDYLKKPESCEKIKILKSKNKRIKANNYDILKKTSKKNEWIGITAVTGIEEAGIEEVFDIEVEELHNFVANGIIVKNCNTKRALVEKNARMQWVDGSLGSKVTMLYPMSVLRGEGSSTSNYNMTFSSEGSWKDTGAKVIHAAPNTTSKIVAKSISMSGGIAAYRGLLRINKGALNAKSHVQCDALILDDISRTDTFPHNEIYEPTASFGHEASVGRISDEQIFYLMNRGLKESEAKSMIVLGFLDEVLKEIPFEYSVEFNRLVKLEFSKLGAVG